MAFITLVLCCWRLPADHVALMFHLPTHLLHLWYFLYGRPFLATRHTIGRTCRHEHYGRGRARYSYIPYFITCEHDVFH